MPAGTLFEERGTILTVFIVCYSLTSFVGGYVSGGYYARNEGRSWIKVMLLTASLFPGVCFAIASILNTIAIFYHSLAAVPFFYILAVLLLWAFISFPLCLVGTILGRNLNSTPSYPCRVKRIPSSIPLKAWYLRPLTLALAGGLLPFGSIFIEIYFVFVSFWNYKVGGWWPGGELGGQRGACVCPVTAPAWMAGAARAWACWLCAGQCELAPQCTVHQQRGRRCCCCCHNTRGTHDTQ